MTFFRPCKLLLGNPCHGKVPQVAQFQDMDHKEFCLDGSCDRHRKPKSGLTCRTEIGCDRDLANFAKLCRFDNPNRAGRKPHQLVSGASKQNRLRTILGTSSDKNQIVLSVCRFFRQLFPRSTKPDDPLCGNPERIRVADEFCQNIRSDVFHCLQDVFAIVFNQRLTLGRDLEHGAKRQRSLPLCCQEQCFRHRSLGLVA